MKKYKKLFFIIAICIIGILSINVSAKEGKKQIQQISVTKNDKDIISQKADGKYEIQIEKNCIIPAERISINALDENSIKGAVNNPDIPVEVKNEIREKIDKGAKEISVYLPVDNKQIKTKGRQETSFYKYKNTEMKAVVLTSTYLSTGFKTIQSGKKAKEIAKTTTSLFLTATSQFSTKVNIFATGCSILTDFIKLCGLAGPDVITPSQSDYVQMNITYDDIDKFVYAKCSGRWTLGLIAKKITLRKVSICEYFKNTKKSHVIRNNTKTVFKYSAHYKNPNAVALSQAKQNFPKREYISWKCHKKTFQF